MSLKINKRTAWHYIVIYLLFMLNDSLLYKKYISPFNLLIFILLCFLVLLHKKMRHIYVFGFLAFSLGCVMLVRLYAGGVGISAWLGWGVPIVLAYYAIMYDKENFLDRWVKLTVFMATISLLFWCGCQINVDLMRKILPTHYSMGQSVSYWTSQTTAVFQTEYGDGLFFYSIRYFETHRNNGVFAEPGLYQMVLNATLFILLFCKDKIRTTDKQQRKYVLILLLTIITCQSTSGYLSAAFVLLMYMMKKNHGESRKNKNRIIILGLIGFAALLFEYSLNGTNSLLYTQVIKKLVSDGQFTLSADSGRWRLMTIATAWDSMLKHPFGIGFDNANALLISGSTGAQIIIMGAALGIIPFLVFQWWSIYPVFKVKTIKALEKLAFLFMYFNSMLSQSKEFYTAFLLISIYFLIENEDSLKKGKNVITSRERLSQMDVRSVHIIKGK